MSSAIFDTSGNLYGSTTAGGAHSAGTIFELSPTPSGPWIETTLHNFDVSGDGSDPQPLVFDSAGNLYGENWMGGPKGCGTVFELSPSSVGWSENLLFAFDCKADGGDPVGGVILDGQGNLYGVAAKETGLYGVIFKVVP